VSVYKPKGKPHYHYDFVFKGLRYHGSTGCASKRAAEAFERKERHKAALPDEQLPAITVNEAAGLYQEHAEHLPSWPTIRYLLEALVYGLGQNKLLSTISQRDLQIYFAKRRADRSNASVNREIENARAVWRYAKASEYDIGKMPNWAQLTLKVPSVAPRAGDRGRGRAVPRPAQRCQRCGRLPAQVGLAPGRGSRPALVRRQFPRKSAVTRIKGAMSSCARSQQPSSKFWPGNPVARMPRPRPSCSPMSARKAVAIAARANAIP
jgi:hypothetical protein